MQREIFLHPLAKHPVLHPFEILQGHCDEVGVVPPEIIEDEGDLAGAAEAEIGPLVPSAPRLPPDMVMIRHHGALVGIEGLVKHVAMGFLEEGVRKPIGQLKALFIVLETDLVRLEAPHLTSQRLDAIVPQPRLLPKVELGEAGHSVIAH